MVLNNTIVQEQLRHHTGYLIHALLKSPGFRDSKAGSTDDTVRSVRVRQAHDLLHWFDVSLGSSISKVMKLALGQSLVQPSEEVMNFMTLFEVYLQDTYLTCQSTVRTCSPHQRNAAKVWLPATAVAAIGGRGTAR